MKESLKKKLMSSGLKWADHVEKMVEGKLAKRANAQEVKGERRRGRPILREENFVKRDLERVVGGWRTTAKDRKN